MIGARRVGIEIHGLDTALRLCVAVADIPRPVAQPGVADLSQKETTTLATWRQTLAASSVELKGQGFFLALRMAENDQAELTRVAVVNAENLFPSGYRRGEQAVGRALHLIFRDAYPALSRFAASTAK
jgi:hypothetical protein